MTVLYQSEFDATSVGAVMMGMGGLVETMTGDRRRLMVMVRELADNALHHSGEGRGWCAVARSYHYVEVVVRDRGQGIHRSLHHLYSDIDERQALQRVFRGGVSGTAEPDRGRA